MNTNACNIKGYTIECNQNYKAPEQFLRLTKKQLKRLIKEGFIFVLKGDEMIKVQL